MGFKLSLAIGVMCGMFGAEFARADSQGAILVIPGKPGIPVIINGYCRAMGYKRADYRSLLTGAAAEPRRTRWQTS